jgi:hypothetical protein
LGLRGPVIQARPRGSIGKGRNVHLAIYDQLTGFGLDDDEAAYVLDIARDVLAKDVNWGEETHSGWKRVKLAVSATNGRPDELTMLRLTVQRNAAANETKKADARRAAFDMFAIAAAASSGRAQNVRIIGFGEGPRYEFTFRASLNGRGTYGFLRPRKVDGDRDTVPAGGALQVYEKHRKDLLIDSMTMRRARDVLPA